MMLSLRNKDVVGLVDEIYVKSRIAKLLKKIDVFFFFHAIVPSIQN